MSYFTGRQKEPWRGGKDETPDASPLREDPCYVEGGYRGRTTGKGCKGGGEGKERQERGEGKRKVRVKGRGVPRMHNCADAVMGQLEAAGNDPAPDDTN